MKSLHTGIYAMCLPDIPVSPQKINFHKTARSLALLWAHLPPPFLVHHSSNYQRLNPKCYLWQLLFQPTPVVNLKIKSPVFVHSNISYWDFKDFKIVTQYMWVWLVSNSIPRAAWLWLECGWSGPHPRIPRCYELFIWDHGAYRLPDPRLSQKLKQSTWNQKILTNQHERERDSHLLTAYYEWRIALSWTDNIIF